MGLPLRGWVVAGTLSLTSAGALAADSKVSYPPCTTAPTEADRNAAKTAFQAGQNSFNEADYATAITYWRDAYKRDCTAHALLLNIARAFELKGDRPEAVTSLETYLQRKPDASDGEQVKRRIDNLKQQIASASVAPTPTATPTAPTATTTGPVPPPPVGGDTGHARGRSPLPLILLGGAGAVAGAIGVVMIAGGASKVSEAENACPDRRCDTSKDPTLQAKIELGNEGRSQQTTGGILLGVGVAAIGTGLILYLTSSPGGSAAGAAGPTLAKGTSVAPAFAPGFAGLSLAGRF